MSVAVELRDVWFRYPGTDWVLRGVSERFYRGETVLVIGGVGSGKTTLARVLTGVAVSVYGGVLRGSVIVSGREVGRDTERPPVSVVGQNPYLYFTDPVVREDIYSYSLAVWRSPERALEMFEKALDVSGARGVLERYFFELSGGEARRALLAKALVSDPDVLVLDEPLMWLDDTGVETLLGVLERLRSLGKTVVVMEHRFLPLLDTVDRVLLLRRGVLVDVTREARRLVETGGGASVSLKTHDPGDTGERDSVVVARGVWYRYRDRVVLRGADLVAGEGEAVLVYGENGSGKTTLLRILAGYLRPWRGRVSRRGDAVYIPQNTVLFFTEETVYREAEALCRARGLGRACVESVLERVRGLGIDPGSSPFNLSQGQQVVLAIELARSTPGVSLLLLDEPFSGLTYTDRVSVLKRLSQGPETKIVTTSSSENLYIAAQVLERASLYILERGVLRPLERLPPSRHSLSSLDTGALERLYYS